MWAGWLPSTATPASIDSLTAIQASEDEQTMFQCGMGACVAAAASLCRHYTLLKVGACCVTPCTATTMEVHGGRPGLLQCLVAAARLLHSRELMQRLACLDIMTAQGGPGRHMRSGLSFALLFPNALNALPGQVH